MDPRLRGDDSGTLFSLVITSPEPVMTIREADHSSDRDSRDKPGHDVGRCHVLGLE
jgi:hypothetical protein